MSYDQALKMTNSDLKALVACDGYKNWLNRAGAEEKHVSSLFSRLDNITKAISNLGQSLTTKRRTR